MPLDPNNVGIAGLLVVLFLMLATGRLATRSEIREKNERIRLLEKRLDARDRQLSIVLTESMTVVSPVLRAMRDAVQADPEEGEQV